MVDVSPTLSTEVLTEILVGVEDIDPINLVEFSIVEAVMGESLLTPGLHTSVKIHSHKHTLEGTNRVKNLDDFKNKQLKIALRRPILAKYGMNEVMLINQPIYRLDRRKLYNNNTDEFILHACHQTLLEDANSLMSKLWKCKTPSHVVREVLKTCIGAAHIDVESSSYPRDYEAKNIHPFQVISQQANAALADGDDPSFLHYMTYKIDDGEGIHHFKSLKTLANPSRNPVLFPNNPFVFSEVGIASGYEYPFNILQHSFPCDFDYLVDLMNASQDGVNIGSLMTFNPLISSWSSFGRGLDICSKGAPIPRQALANFVTARAQNACPDYTHLFLQKRQARMALLEPDRIALSITVPWNPNIHAGNIIRTEFLNKRAADKNGAVVQNYGSGEYLVLSLKHNIKNGGYSTTSMDCVSTSVRRGIV